MTFKDKETEFDSYEGRVDWTPRPKDKPVGLSRLVSVIVLATSAVQVMGIPTI